MSVRIHYFKTWPDPFEAAAVGIKTHEIRRDDRGQRPRAGDLIILQEWQPVDGAPGQGDYTGRELRRRVTFVSAPGTWGLPSDLYVMSIRDADA